MMKICDIKVEKKEAAIIIVLLFLLIADNIKQFFGVNILTTGIHLYMYIFLPFFICIFFRRRPLHIDTTNLLFVAIFILITINVLLHKDEIIWSMSKYKAFIMSMLAFMSVKILVSIYNGERLSFKIVNGLVICNSVLLLLFILLNFKELVTNFKLNYRFETEALNPIWLGRIVSETMLSYLILWNNTAKKSLKYLIVAFEILLLFVLILTGSKGPLFSLFVVVFLYYVVISRKKNRYVDKRQIMFLLVIFFSIVVLMFIVNQGELRFIAERFSLASIFNSAQGHRVHRYLFTISNIPQHFFGGFGLGSWGDYYWGIEQFDYPHNILLEIQFEIGLLGSLLFILIIYKILFCSKWKDNVFLFYFVLELGFAFFSGDFCGGNRGLFLYMGAVSGYAIIRKKQKRNEYQKLNMVTK